MGDEGRTRGSAKGGAGLSAIQILQADLHSDDDPDDHDPAIAETESSGEEDNDIVRLRRKRRGGGSSRRGPTKRRQIVEISSDSDDGNGNSNSNSNSNGVVDLCDTTSDDNDDDDEDGDDDDDSDSDKDSESDSDSDGDSSDPDKAIAKGSSSADRAATLLESIAASSKPAPKNMGELLLIPPFRGQARGAGRGAMGGAAAAATRKGNGGGGGGGGCSSGVVDLALSSDDESGREGGENCIPLRRAPMPRAPLPRAPLRGAVLCEPSASSLSSLAGEGKGPLRSKGKSSSSEDTNLGEVEGHASKVLPTSSSSGSQQRSDTEANSVFFIDTRGEEGFGSRAPAGKSSATSATVSYRKDAEKETEALPIDHKLVAMSRGGEGRGRGGEGVGGGGGDTGGEVWTPFPCQGRTIGTSPIDRNLVAGARTQEHQPTLKSSSSRLCPSVYGFYRTVLRWVYFPREWRLEQDAQSAQRMGDLRALSTEFATLVEYQKAMSRLVFTETLASLQQELDNRKDRRGVSHVRGRASAAGLFRECLESNGQGKNGKGKKGKKAKNRQVKQSSSSALPGSASSSPDGGTLYSLKVVIDLPPPPSYVRDPKYFPKPPFHNNDLVAISAAHWKTSSSSSEFLGVVHSWSPMHGKQGKPPSMLLNLLVCTSKTGVGGDGAGGRGGWMPLKHIQEYVGTTKANSVPVTLSSAGALVTACREFQAVMSLSQMPEGIRRCLLDPSVSKEPKATPATPRSSSFSANSRVGLSSSRGGGADGGGGGADCGEAVVVADAAQCAPPANVPDKLWRSVVQVFNRSQVLAIRKVAEGSPSGFTLLQGPPGTGKTRTIMGIVGVLLAGGCPFPPGRSGEAAARGGGAIVTVGASLKGNGKGKGKGKKKAKKILTPVEKAVPTRVLIVAPSNAAVDELVLRLCQGGVPSADGGVRFPMVVRVGGGKPDMALGDEGGGGGGGGGVGGDNDGLRSQVVEAVSLDHLVEEQRKATGKNYQVSRLNVLLEAEVVCATLSGSGSQHLAETVLLSAQMKAGGSKKGKMKRWQGDINTTLNFDAVVMDEAAQAVEPSSLIPLKFNPRAIVMVGDPAQLPATIFSREAQRANYGQSLFQRLQRGGHPKMMLDTQYRMHPSIASFASSRFYNGLLRSAPTVTEASHGQTFHRLPRFAPYLFHNVSNGVLKRGGGGSVAATSLSNPVEVAYITALLKDLVTTFPQIDFNGRIGVIAPYRNQIQALQWGIRSIGLRHDGVEVSTVDGFQGREKDIMVFSCVRAPELRSSKGLPDSSGGIGFLEDWRRLNVAITRAKFAMWIVGHAGVLKQSTEWRELINDSKKRNAFLDSCPGPSSRDSGNGSSDATRGSTGVKRSSSSTGPPTSGSSNGPVVGKRPCAAPPSSRSGGGGSSGSKAAVAIGGVRADASSVGVADRMGKAGAAGPGTFPPVGSNELGRRQQPGAPVDNRVAAPPSTSAPVAVPPPLPSRVWASGQYYRGRSMTWTRPEVDGVLPTPRAARSPVPRGQVSEVAPTGEGNQVRVNAAATESGGGDQGVANSTTSSGSTHRLADQPPLGRARAAVSKASKADGRTNGTVLGVASSVAATTPPLPTRTTQPSVMTVSGAMKTTVDGGGGGGGGAAGTGFSRTAPAGIHRPSSAVKKCMLAPPVFSGIGTISSETSSSHRADPLPPLPSPPPMPQPQRSQPNAPMVLGGPPPSPSGIGTISSETSSSHRADPLPPLPPPPPMPQPQRSQPNASMVLGGPPPSPSPPPPPPPPPPCCP